MQERAYVVADIKWFDATGSSVAQGNDVDGAVAASSIANLSHIQPGDELVIMGHGDWKHGGMILPFPGPGQEKMQKLEVNRSDRMVGKADDRKL